MAAKEVDGIRLKQAVSEFGSLQKAINSLQTRKKALEADISALTNDIDVKEKDRTKSLDDLNHLDKTVKERKRNLDDLEKAFRKYKQDVDDFLDNHQQFLLQYHMVEAFVAMLQTSPATEESIKELAVNILMIGEATWKFSDDPGKLRCLFVRNVLGNYLHCYRCDRCDLKFIANKKSQSVLTGYYCPNCGFISSVKPDDSYLKEMLGSSKPADTNQRQQPQE